MVNVGIVGLGRMGSDHLERLRSQVSSAKIAGIFDQDAQRCAQLHEAYGYRVFEDFRALVTNEDVDAVLIASPAHLHAEQVVECIAVGKPVLCEKPLAGTSGEALNVVQAEIARGRRLVQLGFMRRFDAAFQGLKAAVASGQVGVPLLMHCIHRNPSVRPGYISMNALNDFRTGGRVSIDSEKVPALYQN